MSETGIHNKRRAMVATEYRKARKVSGRPRPTLRDPERLRSIKQDHYRTEISA